ncbi:hypothetical protein BCR34DRAFT_124109 [Clohesyomyces aquaticus]|uniref:Uncharacterized protein n=1 Tax=Clohesyomyces aquaticus TaxID=1231657 RepID=A0A1Y1YNR2_9PLEO|nr:hypothetical protein BCR34DRAFT_124109 [Clohesyomyces aquaticus]
MRSALSGYYTTTCIRFEKADGDVTRFYLAQGYIYSISKMLRMLRVKDLHPSHRFLPDTSSPYGDQIARTWCYETGGWLKLLRQADMVHLPYHQEQPPRAGLVIDESFRFGTYGKTPASALPAVSANHFGPWSHVSTSNAPEYATVPEELAGRDSQTRPVLLGSSSWRSERRTRRPAVKAERREHGKSIMAEPGIGMQIYSHHEVLRSRRHRKISLGCSLSK